MRGAGSMRCGAVGMPRRCGARPPSARLAAAARRLGRVEAAAVAGDDAVELGQRLDLVDDHAAHLRGALGGLLRQFEDAAAQLGARGLELALHLRRHLLHALQHSVKRCVRLRNMLRVVVACS